MVEITFSDIALENVRDIYDFIAKDSPRFAEIELQKIYGRIEVLHDFPLSGKIVREYNMAERRELIEGNYRIVYQILSENSISIATIHHHSKLLK
jgi:addiction module RelE/StbE family toxin